jgi:hypothetical protein
MLLSHEHRFGHAWASSEVDHPDRWVRGTTPLQLGHPQLRIQVAKLTQLRPTVRDKAVACFEFVRAIPFRAVPDPGAVSSCDVLRVGSGDAHTKGLLFVAMLRSLGIPARLRAVSLRPSVLEGLIHIEGHFIVHVMTEVYLDGRWLSVDAYCLDLLLGLAARARLLRDGRRAGYGVHMNGQVVWDGRDDALSCFTSGDPSSLPIEDLGVYDDTWQVAQHGAMATRGWIDRATWAIGTAVLNGRVRALRRSFRPGVVPASVGVLN